jgi:hypothetical protein
MACGPFSGACDTIIKGVVDGVSKTIFDTLTSWVVDALKSVLGGFSTAFASSGRVNLAQYDGSGLWKLAVGLEMTILAFGALLAFGRAAWTRSGHPAAVAVAGVVKAAAVTALIFSVMGIALIAADDLTSAIMTMTAGSAAGFAQKVGSLGGGVVGGFLGFVFAVIGVLVVIVLWLELLLRAFGLGLVTLTAPISAGGLVLEETAGWWSKVFRAELLLVMLKPVIALCFAVGFTLAAGKGIEETLVGLIGLTAAAAAWPMIARLFPWHEVSMGAANLGSMFGAGGGSSSGGSGAQPGSSPWRTMESAANGFGGGSRAASGGGGGAAAGGAEGGVAAGAAGGGVVGGALALGAAAIGATVKATKTAITAGPQMAGRAADMAGMEGDTPAPPSSGQTGARPQPPSPPPQQQRAPEPAPGPPPAAPVEPSPPPPTAPQPPEGPPVPPVPSVPTEGVTP